MASRLILASGSSVRARLLENAGVPFSIETAKLDEDMIRRSLEADGATARDIVDALAESKARKISNKHEGALVLGCDQVLEFNGKIYSKPDSQAELRTQMVFQFGVSLVRSASICATSVMPTWTTTSCAIGIMYGTASVGTCWKQKVCGCSKRSTETIFRF